LDAERDGFFADVPSDDPEILRRADDPPLSAFTLCRSASIRLTSARRLLGTFYPFTLLLLTQKLAGHDIRGACQTGPLKREILSRWFEMSGLLLGGINVKQKQFAAAVSEMQRADEAGRGQASLCTVLAMAQLPTVGGAKSVLAIHLTRTMGTNDLVRVPAANIK
jgi:hypothetical protein